MVIIRILFGICLAAWTLPVKAQKSPLKFGVIPVEDLKMKIYDQDSSAAAVVLYNYGEFLGSYKMISFLRHTRIKILKKEGLDQADFVIPVLKHQRVAELKASTFNIQNDTIIESKLERDSKFNQEVITGLRFIKIAMPDVKEGSIVELSYTISSGGLVNWEFQDRIPVRHSEYKVFIPHFVEFNVSTQGYIAPTLYTKNSGFFGDGEGTKYHWIFQDVPAFKPEPYISSYKNYITKVNFELSAIKNKGWNQVDILTTWDDVREIYLREQFVDKNVSNSAFLENLSTEIALSCKDKSELIRSIYYYVKREMEWNGRNGIIANGSLKKAFEKKLGNAAEVNLILLALLKYAGIEADPVLISTRDNGFAKTQVPSLNQYDKMVVWVELDNKFVLLDATDKYLTIDFLPEQCLNGIGNGYRAGMSSWQWILIANSSKTKTEIKANFTIGHDGAAIGNIHLLKNGYEARNVREVVATKKHKEYLETIFDDKSIEILHQSIDNADTLLDHTNEFYKFSTLNYCHVAGDAIYFNPILASRIIESPFKVEARTYPVDFGFPKEVTYSATITIPDGYVVDEMPKPILRVLNDNGGKFMLNCVQNGNEINFITKYNLNRAFYSQLEYPDLREFYNQLVAMQSKQIVLKKK
jgi:hypothetical protein